MIDKKTVGIITMHKVVNYGSALQAYALQKVIGNMGYNCEIIDYIFPNTYHLKGGLLQVYKEALKSYIKKKFPIKSAWRDAENMKIKIKEFCRKYYRLSGTIYSTPKELRNSPPNYDIYVTGSDQVWNPRFMKGDASFLLSFVPNNAKKIAYSSSFACSDIPDMYVPAYKKLLSEYAHISVREKNGARLIQNLLNREVPVTLDPTLLLTSNDWKMLYSTVKKNFPKRKYILAYVLNYAFNVIPYIYDLIKYVQKKSGYDVVFIGASFPNELKNVAVSAIGVGPFEFLQLFENASFVVTSSFHGTAFAVNYNIPFYTVVNDDPKKDDRQLSLIKELDLDHRAVPVGTTFLTLSQEWDFEGGLRKLAMLRENSLLYLNKMLRDAVI